MRVMTSTDPEARELRQNSPWLGLLSDDERERIVRSAFEAAGAARIPVETRRGRARAASDR